MDSLPFSNSVMGEKGASIKSKHILIRLRIINEAYMIDDIEFKRMSMKNIPSDMLSKLVPAPVHQHGQIPLVTDSTISLPNMMKTILRLNFV